jgi:hypothetical protein
MGVAIQPIFEEEYQGPNVEWVCDLVQSKGVTILGTLSFMTVYSEDWLHWIYIPQCSLIFVLNWGWEISGNFVQEVLQKGSPDQVSPKP